MSVTQNGAARTADPVLAGPDGELVLVRIEIPATRLEAVLECLAGIPFAINPELHHGHPLSGVEFPAYATWIPKIQSALVAVGVDDARVNVSAMLEALQ